MNSSIYLKSLGVCSLATSIYLAYHYSIPYDTWLNQHYSYNSPIKYYVTQQTSAIWFNQKNSNLWNTRTNFKYIDKLTYPHDPSEFKPLDTNIDFAEEDEQVYDLIKDYTVKLSMPCQSGTAWILDFEIPKEPDTYPLKWFLATNLHVINNFRFKVNPYNEYLPIPLNAEFKYEDEIYIKDSPHTFKIPRTHYTNKKKNFSRNLDESLKRIFNNSEDRCYDSLIKNDAQLTIFREVTHKDDSYQFLAKNQTIEHPFSPFFNSSLFFNTYFFDIEEEPKIFYTNIEAPKLAFAAIDFMGKRKSNKHVNKNYYKDFGVLEVNFKNQEEAKIMTNNFYNKHYKNPKKTKRVNVFAEELMAKNSHNDLLNLGHYYIGGYPGHAGDQVFFDINKRININTGIQTLSTLDYMRWNNLTKDNFFPLKNKYGERLLGHIDLDKMDKMMDVGKTNWSKTTLNNWGYAYMLNNIFLQPGTSGSMTIDKEGNLLGLYRMTGTLTNHGYVETIRSNGILNGDEIILPKFDLITGVPGQLKSYKSNLLKAHPNIETYLSKMNWQAQQ